MTISETKRISEYISGETPRKGHLIFTAFDVDPVGKLEKIKDVIIPISKFKSENWPIDEIWDSLLPTWFLNVIKKNDFDKVINCNNLLWDYGSWLDALKFRGWEWYSSKIELNSFEIILEPTSFPFSVNPLEYVIYEAGVASKSISFKDYSTE